MSDPYPRIGIVMPYYNELELLFRAVSGIKSQSSWNWKLFIVDDGSEQHSRADLNIPQNNQVRVVYKPNGGVSSARNIAIEHIKQEGGFTHIAYCDADDVWEEQHLAASMLSLSVCNADFTYSTPDFKFVNGAKAVPYGIPSYTVYPGLETLMKQNFIYISSVVHKIECCSVGPFDGELNSLEDWDMWLRIAKAGYKFDPSYLKFNTLTYTCKESGNGSKRTEEIYQKLLKKHGII